MTPGRAGPDDIATRIQTMYPHIVEVRVAEDQQVAQELGRIAAAMRAGRPLTEHLSELDELVDQMRVERGRAPAPGGQPGQPGQTQTPGGT